MYTSHQQIIEYCNMIYKEIMGNKWWQSVNFKSSWVNNNLSVCEYQLIDCDIIRYFCSARLQVKGNMARNISLGWHGV